MKNWFKHDYSARNDEKILELRARHGWKGYGVFFAVCEHMHEQEEGINSNRIGALSVSLGLPIDDLKGIIKDLLDIDLLYEDEDGFYQNGRVLSQINKLHEKRKAGEKAAKKRWHKQSNSKPNGLPNGKPNAEVKGSKEKGSESINTANTQKPKYLNPDIGDWEPPTREEVLNYAENNGIPKESAEFYYDVRMAKHFLKETKNGNFAKIESWTHDMNAANRSGWIHKGKGKSVNGTGLTEEELSL